MQSTKILISIIFINTKKDFSSPITAHDTNTIVVVIDRDAQGDQFGGGYVEITSA